MINRFTMRGVSGAAGMIAIILVVLASPSTVLARTDSSGDVPADATLPAEVTLTATEQPDTSEGGSGGIVVTPTDIANEGVAPGQVDLVISTSDGGMLPAGTTACIGDVCQTLSSDQGSGFKWRFERMKEGWQEIRVRGAGPYDGAVSSVRVQPGGLVTAHVEVERVAPSEEERPGTTPPPAQDSPPRDDGSPPRDEGSVPREAGSSTNSGGTQQFAQVTDLPATGSGMPAASAILALTTGLAAALLVLAAIVHLREGGHGR